MTTLLYSATQLNYRLFSTLNDRIQDPNKAKITAESIPHLEGFAIEVYCDPNTTDAERTEMRHNYLLDSFKKKFPKFENPSLAHIQRFTSLDRNANAWYTNTQLSFQKLNTMPNVFFLSELTPQEQEQVLRELKIASDNNAKFTATINAAVKIKEDAIDRATAERSKAFSTLSPLTQVAFITIEHVPTDDKIQIFSAEDIKSVKKDMSNLVRHFKLKCIKAIKSNNNRWHEGLNPF